jgi:aspartyl aminopeptidase
MEQSEFIGNLLDFIGSSPTAFHAVKNASDSLRAHGFHELHDQQNWGPLTPGGYFVSRNDSSLIAFRLSGEGLNDTIMRMAGAHTDSPALKIKPRPVHVNNSLLQLGVETYGGALLAPWFDRDLSIAGRITWRGRDGMVNNTLIDFGRPVAVIPSLAIHLDKEANDRKPVNKQTDMMPILKQAAGSEPPDFTNILVQQLTGEHEGITEPVILDHELFLYDRQPPSQVGLGNEFIAGARLDNLLSCFTLIRGLVEAESDRNCVIILNDHEEIGSLSFSGAQGPFLRSVLERLIPDNERRHRCISRSLFISADNAHAVHPNFADRHDKGHLPAMNGGPVIKYNANQRYATSSRSASFFRILTERAGVPVQEFVMRSDLAGGSTLGPITAAEIGVQTVDVGAPTLAMHSIRELAGRDDAWSLCKVMKTYFALATEDAIWNCLT